jgi:diaminopimelate decarboxylase
LTVPAGWTSRQAPAKWDGESELDGSSALADLLGQPGETQGVWAAAARSKRDLAAWASFMIAWNAHYHGDTCPHRPNTRNRVRVGAQPGVLLAYNCGILVNNVATVHNGVGYFFVFVDHGVAAATDPTDHATFLKILRSVKFPDRTRPG